MFFPDGYKYSVLRFFSFYPFYLMGHRWKKEDTEMLSYPKGKITAILFWCLAV